MLSGIFIIFLFPDQLKAVNMMTQMETINSRSTEEIKEPTSIEGKNQKNVPKSGRHWHIEEEM